MSDTTALIRNRLEEVLAPVYLDIADDSAKHAGHAGAAQHGGGHFRVIIVSPRFAGHNQVQRHRLVFRALGDLMQNAVHALGIQAYAPDEYQT